MAGRIQYLTFVILLAGVTGPPALAQSAEEPVRSIQFWAYRVGSGNWSNIRFEARKEEVDTLSFGKFVKGRVYHYQGPASLIFFREKPEPLPEDPENRTRFAIAQTTIPAGVKDAILIFTAAPSNAGDEFTVHFITADLTGFPNESIRIFNATGVRLAGKVGSEKRYFNSGVSPPFLLDPDSERGFPVLFYVETREGPKFVFEKVLQYAKNRRAILLLEPPQRRGSYKIQVTNLIEKME